jgi:exosortase
VEWRRIDPGLPLLAISLVLLYAPLVPELVGDWMRSGDYSHGFVVPIVTGWLLWRRRGEILGAPIAPALSGGAALLGLGVLMYLVGVAGSEFALQRSSLVPVVGGWSLLLWGRERARPCVFPIAFLLFMIPPPTLVWNAVSLPLQLLASRGAEQILVAAGVDLVREGNIIHLPGISLEIAHACSGLRSLVSLLALGALFAEGSVLGGGRPIERPSRIVLLLAAIPVGVVVNALRVSGTAFAVMRFGPGAAEGTIHELSGAAMFLVALFALLGIRRGIGWVESRGLVSSPAV